jgi:hypothetical protein
MDGDTQDYINFDVKKYKGLKVSYDIAFKNGQEVFTFDKHKFVLGYAKYLLQYLKMKLNIKDGVK